MKERSMPVPEGKRYGRFNGRDLHLYGDAELVEEYVLSFEEMTDACRRGNGIFELPKEWIANKKAEWRQTSDNGNMCYYY